MQMLMKVLKILKTRTGKKFTIVILDVVLKLVSGHFTFKIFHNAIAFNNFLFKINRKDSPNCDFCQNSPETIKHIFCNCEYVTPIWKNLVKINQNKFDVDFTLSNFEKIFGVYKDNFLSYLILCVKYY